MAPEHPSSQSPENVHAVPDATLGGYIAHHNRPPAFEGKDGHPYTVSIEVEKVGDLHAPYIVFLVFPRWAQTGLGIIGHMETPVLWEGSREEVTRRAEELSLDEVNALLDQAIENAESQD